jgi:hypothetical protein
MRLDAATFLLQWGVGGLAFLWVTSRRRIVGIGYGWLLRSVHGGFALLAAVVAGVLDRDGPAWRSQQIGAALVAVAAAGALVVSVQRRRAGVAGQHERRERARERIPGGLRTAVAAPRRPDGAAEFPPALDLVAPAIGVVALAFGAAAAGGPYALALVRLLAGAAFLGAVTDAMLLGHWYLTQPGLPRSLLEELNVWVAVTWPVEVAALLIPDGMVQVFSGAIDDGWNGLLGWTWAACAVSTIVLVLVVRLALRERYYSAVMSATGLLYLAMLTAFGTDLVARAVLAP